MGNRARELERHRIIPYLGYSYSHVKIVLLLCADNIKILLLRIYEIPFFLSEKLSRIGLLYQSSIEWLPIPISKFLRDSYHYPILRSDRARSNGLSTGTKPKLDRHRSRSFSREEQAFPPIVAVCSQSYGRI